MSSTILIPTFEGRIKYLRRTLNSLKGTKHRVLVVVDGPAPDMAAFLMSIDQEFELNYGRGSGRDAVHRGPSANFNFAMQFVKTEKVVFLHDDTFFPEGKHDAVDKLLEKCENGKISRGCVRAFDGSGTEDFYPNYRQDEAIIGGHFFAMTVADWKKVGGLHRRMTLKPTCELEYLIRRGLIEGITPVYVKEAFAAHQRHDRAPNIKQSRLHNLKVIEQVVGELNEQAVKQTLSKLPPSPEPAAAASTVDSPTATKTPVTSK